MNIETLGEDLPLLEGIRTNRAIRRLKPDPVPIELIRKVCEAGTFAPSGGNRQPWQFVAVTDRRAPGAYRGALSRDLQGLYRARNGRRAVTRLTQRPSGVI